MSDHWQSQYLQDPTPTARDQMLDNAARAYHERCEAYDRTVCTGPIGRDGIMPASHRELSKVNQNAREVLEQLRHEYPGISPVDLQRAIANYRPRPE